MPELLLGDGTRKIFVNPHGDRKGLPGDVVSFLDYIKDHTAEDAFTGELEQAVEKARTHKEWEVEYMNWRAYEMDLNIDKRIAREEGLEEGREEGRREGREEGRKEGLDEGRALEIYTSVQEGDYSLQRGAEKLGISVEELQKQMAKAGYRIFAE